MVNSLRTADVSPRSSLLRDVETSLSGDERRETSAIRTLHGWSLGCLAREQAPHLGGAGGGGVRKKIGSLGRGKGC